MYTTSDSELQARQRSVLEKKLLVNTKRNLRWYDMATKGELKKNSGGKKIEFFKRREADESNVKPLTEGDPSQTTPRGGPSILKAAEVELEQYGDVFKISDVANAIDAYPSLKAETEAMGEDAALKADSLIMAAVVAKKLGIDDTLSRFAGVHTGDVAADYATMLAGDAATHKFDRDAAHGAKTALRLKLTPKHEGKYYAGLIPASLTHDFRNDEDWLKPHQYCDPDKIWNGEIGEMDGIRWVETDNNWSEGSTMGTRDNSGSIISAFVLGNRAIGAPRMGGSQDPVRPKITILDQPDKNDPNNQYILAAYKLWWAAEVLQSTFVSQIRAKTTWS